MAPAGNQCQPRLSLSCGSARLAGRRRRRSDPEEHDGSRASLAVVPWLLCRGCCPEYRHLRSLSCESAPACRLRLQQVSSVSPVTADGVAAAVAVPVVEGTMVAEPRAAWAAADEPPLAPAAAAVASHWWLAPALPPPVAASSPPMTHLLSRRRDGDDGPGIVVPVFAVVVAAAVPPRLPAVAGADFASTSFAWRRAAELLSLMPTAAAPATSPAVAIVVALVAAPPASSVPAAAAAAIVASPVAAVVAPLPMVSAAAAPTTSASQCEPSAAARRCCRTPRRTGPSGRAIPRGAWRAGGARRSTPGTEALPRPPGTVGSGSC
mmetsp:Transcript_56556/g.120117  ORF Transcript_56556/g.120117 Transcript_56556/m.120117 type:complete len:322 (-) Transcript_56556:437-1402(-)